MKIPDTEFTIRYLIEDARVRLQFERARKHGGQRTVTEETFRFLPLAAAGAGLQTDVGYYSEDHNFAVTYRGEDPLYCELQAQGYAAIKTVAAQKVEVRYDDQYFYLAYFNEHGFARLELPARAPDGRNWQQLPFTIRA